MATEAGQLRWFPEDTGVLGYKGGLFSSLEGAESLAMKLLEITGSKPAVRVERAFVYFETKFSPIEKIK